MSAYNHNDHISLIYPYMGSGICTSDVRKKISTMDFKNYDRIFNFLVDQESVTKLDNISYSLYKVNIFTKHFSHHLDITTPIGNMYHTTFQASDQFIMFHTLSPETMLLFLISNTKKNKRYIFMPVMFGTEMKKNGHFAAIIFDTILNSVYFMDPNGRPDYFNNMFAEVYKQSNKELCYGDIYDDMIINSNEYIDNCITNYIKILNETFDLKYKYISSTKWNPNMYIINKTFSDVTVIGSGHCVIIGTLLMHCLHLASKDITMIFELFGRLKNEELLEIINGYSVGFIEYLSQ